MKKVIISSVLIAVLVCSASLSAYSVGFNYEGSGWVKSRVSTKDYTALCDELAAPNYFFGARADANGIDAMANYGGGWQVLNIPATAGIEYVAMAEDPAGGYQFLVARASGGLDVVWFNGSVWNVTPISSNTYVALCTNSDGFIQHQVFAAKATGLDLIYFDGSNWQVMPLNSNSYVSLCEDKRSGTSGVYGARAAGGVDLIIFENSWNTATLFADGNYIALTADMQEFDTITYLVLFWGVRANGSIDGLYYQNGVGWGRTNIVPGNAYIALDDDSNFGNQMYGCRANGGLDRIYYGGDTQGWLIESMSNIPYTEVLSEPTTQDIYVATASPYAIQTCDDVKELGYYNSTTILRDFNRDCIVDLTDLADFASHWLECIKPGIAGCDTPWAP